MNRGRFKASVRRDNFGDGAILHAPFHVDPDRWVQPWMDPAEAFFAIAMRVRVWTHGSCPADPRLLAAILGHGITEVQAGDLIRRLLSDREWLQAGSRLVHAETERHRIECMAQVSTKKEKRASSVLSKRLRFSVLERDGFACAYCGGRPPDVVLHVDHVVPVSGGGTSDLSNMVAACVDCNLGKAARNLGRGDQ